MTFYSTANIHKNKNSSPFFPNVADEVKFCSWVLLVAKRGLEPFANRKFGRIVEGLGRVGKIGLGRVAKIGLGRVANRGLSLVAKRGPDRELALGVVESGIDAEDHGVVPGRPGIVVSSPKIHEDTRGDFGAPRNPLGHIGPSCNPDERRIRKESSDVTSWMVTMRSSTNTRDMLAGWTSLF